LKEVLQASKTGGMHAQTRDNLGIGFIGQGLAENPYFVGEKKPESLYCFFLSLDQ
jgi:hypothetical protein